MNKRTAFLLIALGVSAQAWAQDESDALRYSRLTTGGTARTQAIGGAAGSLGGDISATHVNPAGLGFFRTSEVVITPGFNFRSNKTNYLGTPADATNNNFTLANLGIVFGMPTRSNSGWRNVAFALDYNRLADFNNKLYIDGVNTTTSFSDKWVDRFNNNGSPMPRSEAELFDPLGGSLGLGTDLIGIDNTGTYFSRVNPTNPGGIRQRDRVNTKGGANEFSLGVAGNYNDKMYVGLSLNFPTLRFERERVFAEDDESGDEDNTFSFFEYTDRLTTEGVGFNAKLGAIFAPTPSIRLGAAFHTPTWYNMRDASSASMLANTEEVPNVDRYLESADLTDGLPVEYEYSLQTPWRAMGSFSYIFGTNPDVKQQHGFISADVEYVDYAAAKYRFNKGTEDDRTFAKQLNSSIDNLYKSAVNIRVGGELKFNVLAVRAGFAYYGNPYQESDVDGSSTKISGGLGYRNKGFFADLTYVHTMAKDEYLPYSLQGSRIAPASVDATTGSILMTVGFKF